ncbi:glutaredoxin 2 [Vibrio palustris]|uniref:Glutaredoxin-2 n=1 Tax=Vibrio palustris TaxID=1918946 RepID=A0A1R4B1P4_9VIBR|nr:glutaredoxin 2 [Vibrio palustris]SJL82838.1 Glutaredoxin-2 [Vibrio palustris]
MLKLYVYEHCPFCARVSFVAGMLKIPFEQIVLAYDDVATPTQLVGKKAVPILVKEDGTAMDESMDIIDYFLQLRLPNTPQVAPSEEVSHWQSKAFPLLQKIGYPRWHELGLGEFLTVASRQAWQDKKETDELNFIALKDNTAEIAVQVSDLLQHAEPILFSPKGMPTLIDEAIMFSLLRGWVCEPSIEWPRNVMQWLRDRSASTGVSVLMLD